MQAEQACVRFELVAAGRREERAEVGAGTRGERSGRAPGRSRGVAGRRCVAGRRRGSADGRGEVARHPGAFVVRHPEDVDPAVGEALASRVKTRVARAAEMRLRKKRSPRWTTASTSPREVGSAASKAAEEVFAAPRARDARPHRQVEAEVGVGEDEEADRHGRAIARQRFVPAERAGIDRGTRLRPSPSGSEEAPWVADPSAGPSLRPWPTAQPGEARRSPAMFSSCCRSTAILLRGPRPEQVPGWASPSRRHTMRW